MIRKFETLSEFRQFLTRPATSIFYDQASRDADKAFRGTASYEEADSLMTKGDAESAKMIKTALIEKAKTNTTTTERTRQRERTFCGGHIILSDYLQGKAKCCVNTRRRRTEQPVYTIVYNGSVNWQVTTDEIINAAANVVGIIQALEKQQLRVNVYVFFGGEKDNETTGTLVKVKDSGNYLSIDKLAYCLINPSMFRRHYLAYVERDDTLKSENWQFGYGRPIMDKQKTLEVLKDYNVKADRVLTFNEACKL